MLDERGEVARASVWQIRPSVESVPTAGQEPTPFDAPVDSPPEPVFDPPWEGESYFTAMEWRGSRGAVFEPGPAAVWMRARIPQVAGEKPSPLTRVLVVADSGNGISSVSSPLDYLFITRSGPSTSSACRLGSGWTSTPSRGSIRAASEWPRASSGTRSAALGAQTRPYCSRPANGSAGWPSASLWSSSQAASPTGESATPYRVLRPRAHHPGVLDRRSRL
jgi:hypothetical protein